MILIRSTIPEGESWPTLYRLCDPDDNAFASGAISTVVVTAYDLSNVTTPATNLVTSGSRIVSQVWFDTLQTDYGWIADDVGYNFRDVISPAMLTGGAVKGGHTVKVEYKITTFQYGVRQINHLVTVTPQGNT